MQNVQIYTLITIGSVNTTVQSASKDHVVMEILGQSVHVTLPAFSAVRVFPTPLGGVVTLTGASGAQTEYMNEAQSRI